MQKIKKIYYFFISLKEKHIRKAVIATIWIKIKTFDYYGFMPLIY